jgi:hypothetical protein
MNWAVSPDCKYFFYTTGGNDPRVFRMKLANDAVEQLASLKNVRVVDDPYAGTRLNLRPTTQPWWVATPARRKSTRSR